MQRRKGVEQHVAPMVQPISNKKVKMRRINECSIFCDLIKGKLGNTPIDN